MIRIYCSLESNENCFEVNNIEQWDHSNGNESRIPLQIINGWYSISIYKNMKSLMLPTFKSSFIFI